MAVPAPHKELARLEQALRGGGLPAAVVVTGSSGWFRSRAVDLLLAAVPADADCSIVEGLGVEARRGREAAAAADAEADDEAPAEDEPQGHCPQLEPLLGAGLFCSRAFVVVRRGERWLARYGPALLAMLPRIRPGSGLILETAKLDKRTRLGRELAERGRLYEFRDLYETPFGRPDRPLEGELVQWVLAQGRAFGVPLAPESALLLTVQVGKDPADLVAELQRLADRFGSEPRQRPLRPSDLAGLLTVQFESTPFELAEAILAGDQQRAFRSLRAIFARGIKGRDGKPMEQGGLFPFATSWLFQTLGQVLEGRCLLDDGMRLEDVAAQLGGRFFADRFGKQVQHNDRDRLERGLRLLLLAQRQKRLSGEDDEVLLERFLVGWFSDGPIAANAES